MARIAPMNSVKPPLTVDAVFAGGLEELSETGRKWPIYYDTVEPLAIEDPFAIAVLGCWKTVTLVAPVRVVKAQPEGRVRVKLVCPPLLIVVATVPLIP